MVATTAGSFLNNGTLNANGGPLTVSVSGGGPFVNLAGVINAQAGGSVGIFADGNWTNEGINGVGSAINVFSLGNLAVNAPNSTGTNAIGSSIDVSGVASLTFRHFHNDGLTQVNTGATLTLTALDLVNTGVLAAQGGTLKGELNFVDNAGGAINIGAGGVYQIGSGAMTNRNGGSINVLNGGVFTADLSQSFFNNLAGSKLNVSGTANVTFLADGTNDGLIQVNSGGSLTLAVRDGFTRSFTNTGTLSESGGTLAINLSRSAEHTVATFDNTHGAINVLSGGGVIAIDNASLFNGTGGIIDVQSGGNFSASSKLGTIFTNSVGATLNVSGHGRSAILGYSERRRDSSELGLATYGREFPFQHECHQYRRRRSRDGSSQWS
jgi:hypothetical protein